jgi:hypothetical protein
VGPVLDAYNYSSHSTHKIAPNKGNNEEMNFKYSLILIQELQYPVLEVGGKVRVPVMN